MNYNRLNTYTAKSTFATQLDGTQQHTSIKQNNTGMQATAIIIYHYPDMDVYMFIHNTYKHIEIAKNGTYILVKWITVNFNL